MTVVAMVCAFVAAVAYGVGSVLQDIAAARHEQQRDGLDARLMVRLAGELPYVVGLVLDGVGFALVIVALRRLPLFAVQAAVASSIGVTALLAWRLGRAHVTRRDGYAMAGIGVGLVLLGASAQPEGAVALSTVARVVLIAALPVVLGLSLGVARLVKGHRTGVVLGALAGLAFAGTAIAARGLVVPHPLWRIVVDPVALALAGFGVLGLLLFATALQRGSVTTATGALFAAQTVAPAAIGLLLLGDQARPGWAWAAIAGFALTVGGALLMCTDLQGTPPEAVLRT